MKIALIDSGLGLLAAAAAVRRLRPAAALVLSGDPHGMPWGPRRAEDITARALRCAEAAAAERPDALIVACNTASVHALPALRELLEPSVPVVGTVPAIKPAAARGGPVAVWATPATTGSPYQRRLIEEFAGEAEITEVPCHGLADAVERGDREATLAAIRAAAALTPAGTHDVVLGCTHYELVAALIQEQLTRAAGDSGSPVEVRLHGSADAVARQALRRLVDAPQAGARAPGAAQDIGPHAAPAGPVPAEPPGLVVLAGGAPVALPETALRYREGRGLAAARAPA